jgi:hypothetical protein
MPARIVMGALVAALLGAGAACADEVRHSGNVHSFTPADGVLVIEADVRHAVIVRLSRDRRRPWEWREEPTRAYWLSIGTYVTVIGLEDRSGIVRASRVEVPEPDDPH